MRMIDSNKKYTLHHMNGGSVTGTYSQLINIIGNGNLQNLQSMLKGKRASYNFWSRDKNYNFSYLVQRGKDRDRIVHYLYNESQNKVFYGNRNEVRKFLFKNAKITENSKVSVLSKVLTARGTYRGWYVYEPTETEKLSLAS